MAAALPRGRPMLRLVYPALWWLVAPLAVLRLLIRSSLVRRFLRAWRPSLGIVMETEVWPTLIDECKRADIPLVLTNARMSARSFKRAAKFGNATREVFGGFTRVLAQTQSDADRLSALGARNLTVLGNLKFDMAAPPEPFARGPP